MIVNDGSLKGWPFINHAMELRGTQTADNDSRSSIVYPRKAFTFAVEFVINPAALNPDLMQTNLLEHMKNGRLYATLKTIDHPKPRMQTETLRSYNKPVIVPTKMEYDSATIGFHDDNTSVAAALWKEYRAFYQYEGRIGENAIRTNAPTRSFVQEFRQANPLIGDSVRVSASSFPSMGMTLKTDNARHFFDSIIIYDFGADPDSINVYSYMYPVITALDHDGLNYEERNTNISMQMTFDYEGYYHLVGLNNDQFHQAIESFLGFAPENVSPRVEGHARMNEVEPRVQRPTSNFSNTIAGPVSAIVTTPSSLTPVPVGVVETFELLAPTPRLPVLPSISAPATFDPEQIRRTLGLPNG